MSPESQNILRKFREKFDSLKEKRIAVYGTGNYAHLLAANCPDYNFTAFIDPFPGKEVNGVRSSALEVINESNTDFIITACSVENEAVVYERIRDYCEAHHLAVYSIFGYLLEEIYDAGRFQFQDSIKDLYHAIDSHEAISFDLFDTIFIRRTLYPEDVFDITARKARRNGINIEHFPSLRIWTERALVNPTLDQIYNSLASVSGISPVKKDELKLLELDTEQDVLIPREDVVSALCYALDKGHKVSLISDIYLPLSFIYAILQQNGMGDIIPKLSAIYLSGEQRLTKSSGLYEKYRNEVKASSYLHIGDNRQMDGIAAYACGIDPFLIRSGICEFQVSGFHPVLDAVNTINDRILIGMTISCMYNSPFRLSRANRQDQPEMWKGELRTIRDAAYSLIGPMLTAFIIWMKRQADCLDADGILFASRDGFLLKMLYQNYLEAGHLPEEKRLIYFHTSRKASVIPSVRSGEDLRDYQSHVRGFDSIACHSAFSESEKSSDGKRSVPSDSELFAYADQSRANFYSYLRKTGVRHDQHFLLVDFCSSGTTQYALEKLMNISAGLYFAKYPDQLPVYDRMYAFIDDRNRNLFWDSDWLETIITSEEGSTAGYDANGDPVLSSNECHNPSCMEYLHSAQKSLLDYAELFWTKLYDPSAGITASVVCMPYLYAVRDHKVLFHREIFQGVVLQDDVSSRPVPFLSHLSLI